MSRGLTGCKSKQLGVLLADKWRKTSIFKFCLSDAFSIENWILRTQKGTFAFQAKKQKLITLKKSLVLDKPTNSPLSCLWLLCFVIHSNPVVTLKVVRYKDDITQDDVLQLTAFSLTDRVVMTDLSVHHYCAHWTISLTAVHLLVFFSTEKGNQAKGLKLELLYRIQ